LRRPPGHADTPFISEANISANGLLVCILPRYSGNDGSAGTAQQKGYFHSSGIRGDIPKTNS